MLTRRTIGAGLATAIALTRIRDAKADMTETGMSLALFRDATATLLSVAEQLHAADPTRPAVPPVYFVKNADEAHTLALNGPNPIVGMSLDDVLACSQMAQPSARQMAIIWGVHRGFLQLIARPGITGIADLKGKRVAVDTDTGYASALYEILRRNGIDRRHDLEIVYAGATDLRYAKLLKGEFDASLLGAPFTRLATRQNFVSLGSVIGMLGGYQAVVLVAQRSWLAAHAGEARALTEFIARTLEWTRQPENQVALIAMVRKSLPQLDENAAAQITADLFGRASEFLPDGRMHAKDIAIVVDLYNQSRTASLSPETVRQLTTAEFL